MKKTAQLLLAAATLAATDAFAQSSGSTTSTNTTPKVYYACYQASAGIVYRIREPGLPDECRSPSHIMFSWTDATGAISSGSTAGGDLGGSYPNPSVAGLQGRGISNTAPNSGDVLGYNGTNWAPTPLTLTGAAGGDLRGNYPNPSIRGFLGATMPITPPPQPVSGNVLMVDGGVWTAQPLAGDVTGGANNTNLSRIQGHPLNATSPTVGQVLTFNSLGIWAPGNVALPTNSITNAQLQHSSICFTEGAGIVLSTNCVPLGGTIAIGTPLLADFGQFKAQLSSAGVLNSPVNPVDWTELKNVPPSVLSGSSGGAAVAGYEIRTQTLSLPASPVGTSWDFDVSCSAGKKALSGGVWGYDPFPAQQVVFASFPQIPNGNGWHFTAAIAVTGNADVSRSIQVYVICANAA